MNTEEDICPYCLEGYNAEGYCSCGSTREDKQAWLEQGRDWAREYLPEGWEYHSWKILKSSYGRMMWRDQTLVAYCWTVLGQHPDGWYGVIVCDPDERAENDIFNFHPPGEGLQVGPLPTEEAAEQALLYRLTQLEQQLKPIPLPSEEEVRVIKDRFAQSGG
jgi:hypothetical protein